MKTLDKEGLQYTLQRMVTLLAAIQEKVNAPYPEYKEGTWKPVLFNTDTDEVTDVLTALGFYYKIGNLVFIDGYINANNACACHHIAGLPFEPSQDNPASMYPLSIGALGADKDSTFNIIYRTKPYGVFNELYSPDETANTWHIHGWYKIADTK